MANSARIDELRKKFDENPRRYFAPLANEYRKLGDLEQAIFICQEYLPQQPGHMSGHIVYGQALFEAGRMDEARGVFETALTLDPENLIALRHLGDIAHSSGDSGSARSWYQRVLEVDPRNDEIAALITSLESAPVAAAEEPPPIPESAAPPEAFSEVAADEPMTVERSEEPPPIPIESTSLAEPEGLLDLDEATISGFETSSYGSTPSEAPPAVEPEPASASVEASNPASFDDLQIGYTDETISSSEPAGLELDGVEPTHAPEPAVSEHVLDSAIEGLELSTPTSWPATPPSETPPHGDVLDDFTAPTAAASPSLTSDETPLETVPFDIPVHEATTEPVAAEASAEEEPVSEFDIAEFETPVGEPAVADEDLAPAAQTSEFEAPVAEPVAAGEALDASFDIPMAEIGDPEFRPTPERSSAAVDRDRVATPVAAARVEEEPAQSSSAGLFVTETMAELYLQQGHLESALSIYTTLVEQRPDDAALAARRRAVEDQMRGPVAAESTTPAGPTIREFLTGFLGYRAAQEVDVPSGYEGGTPVESVSVETGGDPFVDFPEPEDHAEQHFAAPTPAAPVVEQAAPSRPPTPASSHDTVRGSIDTLFGSAQATDEDVAAASALADAFAAETPEAPLLTGVPAHKASSERSLDHVFRAGAPAPEAASESSFSFDQFFAEDMSDQKTAAAPDQAASPNTSSADDIAQFNAWLSGLKKT